MKIKKRHVVLASLVLALSAAVYLNWQLSDSSGITVANTSKELGAASYVNSNKIATQDEAKATSAKPDTISDEQAEYFAAARNDRKKAQDEVLSVARDALELSDSSDEAKKEAVEQLSELEDAILCQNRIETTLKAKGFSDCICCLTGDSCTVIVPEKEFTDAKAIIIQDCVTEVTDVPFENINIVKA